MVSYVSSRGLLLCKVTLSVLLLQFPSKMNVNMKRTNKNNAEHNDYNNFNDAGFNLKKNYTNSFSLEIILICPCTICKTSY